MLMFKVFTTEEFDKDFNKLDKSEQIRAVKVIKQLKEQGDQVGKPLSGLSFFKEKRLNGKRLYFLVYKDISIILALTISDKKAQQVTINQILVDIAEYQRYVYETLRKRDFI